MKEKFINLDKIVSIKNLKTEVEYFYDKEIIDPDDGEVFIMSKRYETPIHYVCEFSFICSIIDCPLPRIGDHLMCVNSEHTFVVTSIEDNLLGLHLAKKVTMDDFNIEKYKSFCIISSCFSKS